MTSHAVWLYFRFPPSLRMDNEEVMRRYNRDAKQKREMRTQALAAWNEVTRARMAMV